MVDCCVLLKSSLYPMNAASVDTGLTVVVFTRFRTVSPDVEAWTVLMRRPTIDVSDVQSAGEVQRYHTVQSMGNGDPKSVVSVGSVVALAVLPVMEPPVPAMSTARAKLSGSTHTTAL
jgi:hypothetical protein